MFKREACGAARAVAQARATAAKAARISRPHASHPIHFHAPAIGKNVLEQGVAHESFSISSSGVETSFSQVKCLLL